MWQPFGELIDHAINRAGVKRTVSAAVVVDAAQQLIVQVVPELRPTDFQVVSFKGGTITIIVASAMVASELSIRTEALLDALRHELPESGIMRLLFRPMRTAERSGFR